MKWRSQASRVVEGDEAEGEAAVALRGISCETAFGVLLSGMMAVV
jgi:hypothetical protein